MWRMWHIAVVVGVLVLLPAVAFAQTAPQSSGTAKPSAATQKKPIKPAPKPKPGGGSGGGTWGGVPGHDTNYAIPPDSRYLQR